MQFSLALIELLIEKLFADKESVLSCHTNYRYYEVSCFFIQCTHTYPMLQGS